MTITGSKGVLEAKAALALAIIVAIVAGALGYYLGAASRPTSTQTVTPQAVEREVVIYTYESLLKWGKDPDKTWDLVFGEFERITGIKVRVREFPDARTMLLTLIEERNDPRADVVIGIDNVLIVEAIDKGVLEPYRPKCIEEIRSDLVESLDPQFHVVPYDYGLIAFVYDRKYVNEENTPQMTHLKFEDFEDDLASMLVVEDPTQSSTGISFLLWQITVYEKVLGRDWREWWTRVRDSLRVSKSWGDAYDVFLNEERNIVVSYGTDPAYSLYFYNSTRYGAAVVEYEGKKYAWLQIEGIGLVKGAKHVEEAKMFIEWFLSPHVQRLIPLNNWMYPANVNVDLPPAYRVAVDPDEVIVVNRLISIEEIASNLKGWLEEWETIMTG